MIVQMFIGMFHINDNSNFDMNFSINDHSNVHMVLAAICPRRAWSWGKIQNFIHALSEIGNAKKTYSALSYYQNLI